MEFKQLNIIPEILKRLAEEGYVNPTPIQEKSIPIILQGKDVFGCAQTGTGKTASFAIPIIQQLFQKKQSDQNNKNIKALILTPTRELATQIGENIESYAANTGITHTVIFGGVGQNPQVKVLRRGVDIVIATPGRLLDLIQQKHVQLAHINIFVLDEADRMLDMGFINDIKKVIARLPNKRQSLFFSATMPASIMELANAILKDPIRVAVSPVSSTVETVKQQLYFVEKQDKKDLLVHLMKDTTIESALVFTRTKHGADKVAQILIKAGIKTAAIHGNKSQNNRQNALNDLKSKKIRVLVATDIAARGIDINELSHVFMYDIPTEPETYVHRIGRTGRAGAKGVAIAFCDSDEKKHLKEIIRVIKQEIPVVKEHPYLNGHYTPAPKKTPRPPRPGRGVQAQGISVSQNRSQSKPQAGTGRTYQGVARSPKNTFGEPVPFKGTPQRHERNDAPKKPHKGKPHREGEKKYGNKPQKSYDNYRRS